MSNIIEAEIAVIRDVDLVQTAINNVGSENPVLVDQEVIRLASLLRYGKLPGYLTDEEEINVYVMLNDDFGIYFMHKDVQAIMDKIKSGRGPVRAMIINEKHSIRYAAMSQRNDE